MTEAENEYIKKTVSANKLEIPDLKIDQEIKSESSKQNYLGLITENIRSNNRAIQRNSFILIVSTVLYFLMLWGYVNNISLLNFQLTDTKIVLNGIAVIFSYLYMVNVIRWYNNNDLRVKFDALAKDLYKIGAMSQTIKAIRPFSILFHGLDYQIEKKELKSWMKWPGIFLQFIVLFGPIIFDVYLIVNMFRLNTCDIITIVSFVLTVLITVNTIIYAAKSR